MKSPSPTGWRFCSLRLRASSLVSKNQMSRRADFCGVKTKSPHRFPSASNGPMCLFNSRENLNSMSSRSAARDLFLSPCEANRVPPKFRTRRNRLPALRQGKASAAPKRQMREQALAAEGNCIAAKLFWGRSFSSDSKNRAQRAPPSRANRVPPKFRTRRNRLPALRQGKASAVPKRHK